MSKLGDWSQWLWLEVQLTIPWVVPWIREVKEVGKMLLVPNLTIYQWQGQTQTGGLTVNYAGTGDAVPFLKNLLFIAAPSESVLDRIPFRHIHKLARLPGSDITIVEAHKRLIHQLPVREGLVLPAMVEMILDVEGEWTEIERRFHSSAQREFRSTYESGYDYEVSHRNSDFENFYHNMYVPNTKARHGDQAVIMPIQEAYQYFRHGGLFLVIRDGQRVSGSVFCLGQDKISFVIVGVQGGDVELLKEGAVGALNCLRLQWANQQGCKIVDFGYCRPFVGGIFRYKRKWGTSARVPSDLSQRLWIRLQHNTPAVHQFMRENPCIVIGADNQPYLLVTIDSAEELSEKDKAKLRKEFEIPGMRGLLVRSTTDLVETPVQSIARMDPTHSIIF